MSFCGFGALYRWHVGQYVFPLNHANSQWKSSILKHKNHMTYVCLFQRKSLPRKCFMTLQFLKNIIALYKSALVRLHGLHGHCHHSALLE